MRLKIPIPGVLLLLTSATTVAQSVPAAAGPVQPPALTELNNAFRAAYADAKSRVLASSAPTLVVNGDRFTMIREGRRVEANVGTPVYDPLKTVAHIPLAIYVILTPGDGALDEHRLETLAKLRTSIQSAGTSLSTLELPDATLARQKHIASASMAFIEEVLNRRKFARSSLLAFTRGMAPLV